MSTKQVIKKTLSLLTKVITVAPKDKQSILHNRVSGVLKKHQKSQSQSELQLFRNDLQFNLNFIRLAYPDIDIATLEKNIQDQKPLQSQKNNDSQENNKQLNSGNLFQLDTSNAPRQPLPSQMPREQVEFSNWFEGNADPQNLQRHRKLLQRQHFMGDFWKNRQKPVSYTRQYLQDIVRKGPPEQMPQKKQQFKKPEVQFQGNPDDRFQKIKR